MHDTASSRSERPLVKETTGAISQFPGVHTHRLASLPAKAKKRSWLMRLMGAFMALLAAKKNKPVINAPEAMPLADQRAATAIAAQMAPPMAFRGDTANTLVTPMGAYAGKPVEQATRKRAEQQFKNFDTTTATMN